MKTMSIVFVSVLVAGVGLAVLNAYGQQQKPAETITVKGELVDLNCYLSAGLRGPDHKDCATTCAKAGNPIGILTDKGDVYLLLGSDKAKPVNQTLADKMAATVSITGKLAKKGGLQAIYISEVK